MDSPSPVPPLQIAVIGAGYSGLAAAIRALDLAAAESRPVAMTVFEASPSIGGLVATQTIDNYLVERGADAFITNKPGGIEMCRRLGLEASLIATDPRFRQSFVLSRGRPVPTPAGFQLLAPTRVVPFLKSPLLSWKAKKRVLAETKIPPRRETSEESIGAFVRRRFGDEAFDRLVQPMVGGIYTGDLDRLSLAATFPRFAQMEQQHGSVLRALRHDRTEASSGARYGLFVTLPGGMSELLNAMAAEVRRMHSIELSAPVERLARRPDGSWEIVTQGRPREFAAVIAAVPAFHAARLLASDHPPLSGELGGIEYSSSAIVVTGHRLRDIAHPLNGAGLVIPQIEQRRILAVSFASRKFPGRAPEGRVILRTFLGGALQVQRLESDDAELRRIVLEELADIFGVSGTPDFCEVVRYPRGIPQFVLGHRDRVARIESHVNDLRGFALAGNAYHGVGIPDAIQSGVAAAQKVWADITHSAGTPSS